MMGVGLVLAKTMWSGSTCTRSRVFRSDDLDTSKEATLPPELYTGGGEEILAIIRFRVLVAM